VDIVDSKLDLSITALESIVTLKARRRLTVSSRIREVVRIG